MATSPSDERVLSGLVPDLRNRAEWLLYILRYYALPAIAVSGRRSILHQLRLIAAGQTAALRSKHLSGRAIDIGFQGYRTDQVPRNVWAFAGAVGEALGLRWGGRFSTYDPVHFDL